MNDIALLNTPLTVTTGFSLVNFIQLKLIY
jgi:hypothetical protein